MKKALLYKEWKKTKWVCIGIFLTGLLLLTYIFMKLGRSFRFAGLEHLWDVIINRNQFLFKNIKYFPLAAGLSLGIAQFTPEIIKKRIKLSLHLPLTDRNIISVMLGFGIILLIGTFAIHLLGIYIFAQIYFPPEIIHSIWITFTPWYTAGITAYLFIAMIYLEPTWKRRIFYILLMFGTLNFLFLSESPGAYNLILFYLVIIPIYVLPFTYLSVYRFKTGKQD